MGKKLWLQIKKILKKNRTIYMTTIKGYHLIREYIIKKSIKYKGADILNIISQAFSDLNVEYFIDFGTLLGFIREGGFIKHDLDIDIGIPYSNNLVKENISNKLTYLGFKKISKFIFDDIIVEESYEYAGVKIDLLYYENDDKNSYCYVFYKDENKNYPSIDLFSTCKYKYSLLSKFEYKVINNVNVKIPKNPKRLLTEKYGEDWEVPNKDWLYWKGPNAIYPDEYGRRVDYRNK